MEGSSHPLRIAVVPPEEVVLDRARDLLHRLRVGGDSSSRRVHCHGAPPFPEPPRGIRHPPRSRSAAPLISAPRHRSAPRLGGATRVQSQPAERPSRRRRVAPTSPEEPTPMATTAASPTERRHAASKRYIYAWGDGRAEGSGEMKDLLGGKGAGLAEMTIAGLPTPPGFTITTEACNDYFAAGERLPDGLWDDVLEAMREVEQQSGKGFGDAQNPLLVSVRSGAKFSMPGMMDTVLNLGLNEQTLNGLVALTGNERFGWDAYRRFIAMFGRIVMDVPASRFDHALEERKGRHGEGAQDTDLDVADLKTLVDEFKAIVKQDTGRDFPTDPNEQLDLAIKAVFASWFGQRARDYRKFNK